jgi:catechol 2,3-dioxygenase-like lactoylglutathione lyase family enzyme
MIDHTAINVSDLSVSRLFYQSVLAAMGYVIRHDSGATVGYGLREPASVDDPGGEFWLAQGEPFAPRSHIAFRAESRLQVDEFHRVALALGARDNGAPGLRPHYHPHYYASFVLDPDGYNIEAVCHHIG